MNDAANNAYWETQNNVLAHKISHGSSFNNVSVDNNLDEWKAQGAAAGTADTEFFILHNLSRIPIHFHWITDDGSVIYSFYGGMTPWTAATSAGNNGKIYVKCTKASSNYKIIIY